MNSNAKPTSHQADLTKLLRTLAPLTERSQWAVWRWTQQGNGWQKPPFIATQPERHASTKDCKTWTDYATALATVQAGKADGISYILTEDDPLAAIDLDHCRAADTHSIDVWAQNFLDSGRHSYSEVTPSGTGCRIWGFADGDRLHRWKLIISRLQLNSFGTPVKHSLLPDISSTRFVSSQISTRYLTGL